MFFGGMFVVVIAFTKTGLPDAAWNFCVPAIRAYNYVGIVVFVVFLYVTSNLFNNVPVVLLVTEHVTKVIPGETV